MAQRALCIFDRPVQSIAQEFNKCGFRYHEVPNPLYARYLGLYKKSEILHDKMKETMEDGEHLLLMEEGRRHGFDLPSDDYLQDDLKSLKKALKAFDPYQARVYKHADVRLSAEQIQGFFNVFTADYDIFHAVAETIRYTDYMKVHRYMRDVRGVKYAGPAALQVMLDVFVDLSHTHKKQIEYLKQIIPEFSL